MRILIIGGTGNISSPLTNHLINRGDSVTLYNRGNQPVPGATQMTGDRTDHAEFENQMAKEKYWDCVIDMVGYHPDDARSVVRAFKGRVGQYIFCSTVDVYTKTGQLYPISEDGERKPSSEFPYAFNKAIMEDILLEASGPAFPVTIIRPAATYNDTWSPISPIGTGLALLKRIRQRRPVIVLGDGMSIWVSSHRDDVAKAFLNAVGNEKSHNKSYNVTGDEWMTWRTYYQTAADVMGVPEVHFLPISTELLGHMAPLSAQWSVVNFRYNNIFDNSAAKADLAYEYTVTWREGVSRMVAYHDATGAINNADDSKLYEAVVESYSRMAEDLAIQMKGIDI